MNRYITARTGFLRQLGARLCSDWVNHCIYDGLNRECADPSNDKSYDWKDCLEKTDLIWRRDSFIGSLDGIKVCESLLDMVQIRARNLNWSDQDRLEFNIKKKISVCRRDAKNRLETEYEVICQSECLSRFYNYDVKSETIREWNGNWEKTTWVKIVHNKLPSLKIFQK